jgi:hypothetical protein
MDLDFPAQQGCPFLDAKQSQPLVQQGGVGGIRHIKPTAVVF